MHISIIYSKASGSMSAIVSDQIKGLVNEGCTVSEFVIEQSGLRSYFRAYWELRRFLESKKPDIVLANYGLVCLLSNLQRKVPVISMYHGSDIHFKPIRYMSYLASRLSKYNIFVHPRQRELLNYSKKNYSILPCGYDNEKIYSIDRSKARKEMCFADDKTYILFPSSFERAVKNPELAKQIVAQLDNVELIELKGYDKRGVNVLMNAVDIVLLTSNYETGPLVIKEAMAVGTPVVSLDVGDVALLYGHLDHCRVVSRDVESLVLQVKDLIDLSLDSFKNEEYVNLMALKHMSIHLKRVISDVINQTGNMPFNFYEDILKQCHH